jgi:predicted SAM-dependent methyltransferase
MKLHLCCGPIDHRKNWVNVDAFDFGQDVVADLNAPWSFAQPGTVEEIVCNDGFEHVTSAEHFLAESARALKPGGTLSIWVPHFKNPSAYRLTHRLLLSWSFFDAYPEPHDHTQSLKVVSNRIYIGHKESAVFAPVHWLANLIPKWWERLLYVSNIQVVMQKARDG